MYNFVNVDQFLVGDQVWTALGDISGYTLTTNVLELQFVAGQKLHILFHTPTIFRVRFNKDSDYSHDYSYAVDTGNLPSLILGTGAIVETSTNIIVNTGSIELDIAKSPYALTVKQNGQIISQDSSPGHNGRSVEYILESVANYKAGNRDSHYYGFGLKAGPRLDKSAETMTFFNFDNFCAPPDDSQAMYTSIPFMIEVNTKGPYVYGLFLDNPSQTYFDLGFRYTDTIYFGALFGELNYYFIAGNDVKEIVGQFTSLTGRSKVPPKYALGFHQGGYGYNVVRFSVPEVAQNYRNSGIPIDGLHIDVDFQDQYRTFTSSPTTFPNAPQMIATLKEQGFKCSTNITAMIKNDGGNPPYPARDSGFATKTGDPWGVFLTDPNYGGPYLGTENYGTNPHKGNEPLTANGFYPDFTRPGVADWWGQQYDYLFNTAGIEMVWQDMMCPAIDPQPPYNPVNPNKTFPLGIVHYDFGRYQPNVKIHNHFGLKQLEATTSGLRRVRPTLRPFIIARGGYAGVQKYAALWTGDSASEWPDYQRNISMVLNLGLSGVPISGSDIGGFANGKDVGQDGSVSSELLTRWMTMGAFLPWYRNHYDTYTKAFQEPWAYNDPAVVANCKKYVELRYHFLPFFYDLAYEHSITGFPIARPVFFENTFDAQAHDYGSQQFSLGSDIVVAPVLTHGAITKTVYLPLGNWYAYDFGGAIGAPVTGPTQLGLTNVTLDVVPVYIREGAIIPTCEVRPYVGAGGPNPITVDIYPGADRVHVLYQDDETTNDWETGVYRTTEIKQVTSGNTRTVSTTILHGGYSPDVPYLVLRLLGVSNPPSSVTVAGAAVASGPNGYQHDPVAHLVTVQVPQVGLQSTVVAVSE